MMILRIIRAILYILPGTTTTSLCVYEQLPQDGGGGVPGNAASHLVQRGPSKTPVRRRPHSLSTLFFYTVTYTFCGWVIEYIETTTTTGTENPGGELRWFRVPRNANWKVSDRLINLKCHKLKLGKIRNWRHTNSWQKWGYEIKQSFRYFISNLLFFFLWQNA